MKELISIVIIILELHFIITCCGILQGKYCTGFLGWYTHLSNILILFLFVNQLGYLLGLWASVSNNFILYCALAITMTFLIYHFLLSPSINAQFPNAKLGQYPYNLSNFSVHYICPILTIVYWFACTEKSGIGYIDGIKWLIIPALYIVYIFIRVKLKIRILENGKLYPYDFMDVSKFGLKRVSFNIVVLCILFALLGLLYVQIGMWLK